MFNRVSAVSLLLGVIGGYALAGSSVTAQNSDNLFATSLANGNTVRLTFGRGTFYEASHAVTCTVAEIQGRWIRCRPADSFQEAREQQWYSLDKVLQITKLER